MPNSSELEALIGRLENLGGPDRFVDMLVAWVTGWDAPNKLYGWGDVFPRMRSDWQYASTRPADNWGVPTYTASIDAAVALVERCLPGWSWEVMPGSGTVFNGDPDAGTQAFAATPAIALCLALLRALSERQQEREG